MAFQRIRIKNSNVVGKIPGADKLDVAELCINLKDQKLYSKDADGNVFELGSNVNSGGNPPGSGNNIGDLFWDGDILLIWNGTDWEPVAPVTSVNGEVGDVVLELGDLDDVAVDGVTDEQVLVYDANAGKWVAASAASLAVDVDLEYEADPAKGTIINSAGDDAEIPLVDETNAGLMSPADYEKLAAMPGIISGPTPPTSPSPGDIWIDTNDCPPTINIWDDCDDPGNPTWKPIGGGGGDCIQGPVQITSSNGTNLNSTLTAVGGNGVDDSISLSATYEWSGAKTGTGSSIVADVEGDYTVTAKITCTNGAELVNTAVWTITDTYVDMVNNTPPVIAVVGGGEDEAYEGNSIYVVNNATVTNGEIPSIVETQWFKDGVADGTGSIYTIGASDEGAVITARQLFRDLRNNELLSDPSNGIEIVSRPPDVITFNPVITDDGTPQANTPGHVLTASAENIVGGVAPVEYAYKWIVEGLTMGSNKTLNIISTFVGKLVSCEITVAEPDGTNPETRTATYSKVIELAGTIDTPEVLAPADGAGSGATRYLISDAITEVEGGGIDRCETELIESVDDTTDAPNIILTFPDSTGFDCFADGDVVQGAPDVKAHYGPWQGSYNDALANELDLVNGEEYDMSYLATWWWNKDDIGSGSFKFDLVSGEKINIYKYKLGDENVIKEGPYSGGAGNPSQVETFTLDESSFGPDYQYIRIYAGGTGYCTFTYNSDIADVKIVGEPDSDNNTIVVDGGEWASSQPITIAAFDSYGVEDPVASLDHLNTTYNSREAIEALPQSHVNNNLGTYYGGVSYDGNSYPVQEITGSNTWAFNFLQGGVTQKEFTQVRVNGTATVVAYTANFTEWTQISVSGTPSHHEITVPAGTVCTATWRNNKQGVGFDIPCGSKRWWYFDH